MSNVLTKFLLFAACPIAIAVGSWCLADYSNRPGPSGNVAERLDSDKVRSLLGEDCAMPHRTLMVFYHPHCPCTKASIRNLERLNCRFPEGQKVLAFAYCPTSEPDSWINSSLTNALNRIPNTEVVIDRGGKTCIEYGVSTSGHTLVYDGNGSLLFSGAITPGRGHEGDCAATASLLKALTENTNQPSRWPVYGCTIATQEEPTQ